MNLIWTPKDRYTLKPLKPFSKSNSDASELNLFAPKYSLLYPNSLNNIVVASVQLIFWSGINRWSPYPLTTPVEANAFMLSNAQWLSGTS